MSFWIAAALLTIVATALFAAPLLRAPRRAASALDYDRELYRARLREIDADLKFGRIGEVEAEAAKAEEGRKLLALSATDSDSTSAGSSALARFTLYAAVVFVPLAAILFYVFAGVPNMQDMAIASRPDRDLSRQTLTQLLDRAEAQLARDPDDVRGWRVVAPVYMRLGRVQDAVMAWRNALRLSPDDVDLKTSLAEAMTAASGGVVTEEARRLFDEALEKSPRDAKARFYTAIALGQQGAKEEAIRAWRDLIAEAPAEAPWLPVAQAQLAALTGQSAPPAKDEPGTGEAARPPAGPTGEDVASASALSAEDRQAMIEGMVAGLAEKLKDNPRDKAGWQRLVRSYAVLGRAEDARKAVDDARAAFPGDKEFLAQLETLIEQTSAAPTAPKESTQ